MRLIVGLVTMLGLCACDAVAPVAVPSNPCEAIASAVPLPSGMLPSADFITLQKLACYYGFERYRLELACPTPLDLPEYFFENGKFDDYGLKRSTFVILLRSYSYGAERAQNEADAKLARLVGLQDDKICMNGIRNIPEDRASLVAITKELPEIGY